RLTGRIRNLDAHDHALLIAAAPPAPVMGATFATAGQGPQFELEVVITRNPGIPKLLDQSRRLAGIRLADLRELRRSKGNRRRCSRTGEREAEKRPPATGGRNSGRTPHGSNYFFSGSGAGVAGAGVAASVVSGVDAGVVTGTDTSGVAGVVPVALGSPAT